MTLLPQGQKECYNAGVAFSQRYLNLSSCQATSPEEPNTCLSPAYSVTSEGTTEFGAVYGPINNPSGKTTWNNYNLYAVSSALDRTLLSARSFLSVSAVALQKKTTVVMITC